MAAGEELEFKLRLPGPQAVAHLLRLILGPGAELPPAVVQTNHFLDTEDRMLRNAQLVIRIRQEGERWFLTAKGPVRSTSADGVAVTRGEDETSLSSEQALALLAGEGDAVAELEGAIHPRVSSLLAAIRDEVQEKDLLSIGSFQNERTRLQPIRLEPEGPELQFEFDRTSFPGGRIDHEVEVELATSAGDAGVAEVETALRALFQRAELPWETNSSKVRRFFTIVEEQPT